VRIHASTSSRQRQSTGLAPSYHQEPDTSPSLPPVPASFFRPPAEVPSSRLRAARASTPFPALRLPTACTNVGPDECLVLLSPLLAAQAEDVAQAEWNAWAAMPPTAAGLKRMRSTLWSPLDTDPRPTALAGCRSAPLPCVARHPPAVRSASLGPLTLAGTPGDPASPLWAASDDGELESPRLPAGAWGLAWVG
jgi:hypothetical protein